MDYILGTFEIFKNKIFSTDYLTHINRIEPSVPWYQQYMYFYSPSQEIVTNLFLGSSFNAYNLNELIKNKIDVIINISDDVKNFHENKFKYYRFKISDNDSDDISRILDRTFTIISDHLLKGDRILVHCFMGASRSASVIIYYLMRRYDMSYEVAKGLVMIKRPIVNLSLKFHNTLQDYSIV
jgi:protein-tyrosine phosphatase